MTQKTFAKGLIVKRNDKAPDFVICNLAINIAEFAQFIKDNRDGDWINIDVKRSKSGIYYAELNDWKPNSAGMPQAAQPTTATPQPSGSISDNDDLPF